MLCLKERLIVHIKLKPLENSLMKRFWQILFFLFPLAIQAQINTERVMMIARNALYFEDYVLSIQYFNQVINARPYLYEPYFFRGLAKINLDDYQGAESDCSEVIQRNPFVIGAYQIRGLARIRQNKFDDAISDYRTALRYDPENLVLWHNLSLCHIQKEDFESAKDDLESLLRIAPRYTHAYLMRGEVSLKQKDTIQALNDFEKAIELDRYDGNGWAARAIVRIQQKKYKEAEEDLNQAIHLSVHNASNYINRALVRFYQNNLRGAMSDYDLALDLDPNNFIGHYNRGLAFAANQPCHGGALDLHRTHGAELLTAEASSTFIAVDHRFFVFDLNGFGRTDIGTNAAAYAFAFVNLGFGSQKLTRKGAEKFTQLATAEHTFELKAVMLENIFVIGDEKAPRVAVYLYLGGGFGCKTAQIRRLESWHVLDPKAYNACRHKIEQIWRL